MNGNAFNIQRKEDSFFATISFNLPNENIVNYLSSEMKNVIQEYSISEERILNVSLSRIPQKDNECVVVSIKYSKFSPRELKVMDKSEQIRFVLKLMGYADTDIKSITYRKYWSNSNKLVWVARVADPNYDFDLDESYSAANYEKSVMNSIREVLSFQVIVDFI